MTNMQQVFLLDDYDTHLVVGSISINWKGLLWLGYAIRTFTTKIVSIILNSLSISGVQQRFLSDLSESGFSICASLGHMSQCVLTTP